MNILGPLVIAALLSAAIAPWMILARLRRVETKLDALAGDVGEIADATLSVDGTDDDPDGGHRCVIPFEKIAA